MVPYGPSTSWRGGNVTILMERDVEDPVNVEKLL